MMVMDGDPQEILTQERRPYGSNPGRLKYMLVVILENDVPHGWRYGKVWTCCVAKARSPPPSNLTVGPYLQNLI